MDFEFALQRVAPWIWGVKSFFTKTEGHGGGGPVGVEGHPDDLLHLQHELQVHRVNWELGSRVFFWLMPPAWSEQSLFNRLPKPLLKIFPQSLLRRPVSTAPQHILEFVGFSGGFSEDFSEVYWFKIFLWLVVPKSLKKSIPNSEGFSAAYWIACLMHPWEFICCLDPWASEAFEVPRCIKPRIPEAGAGFYTNSSMGWFR